MTALVIAGIIVLFFAVILVRTAMFKPSAENKPEQMPVEFDRERAVERFRSILRCRTVSYPDHSLEDAAEFDRLRSLLVSEYPNVNKACTLERVGRTGMLFCLKGESDAEPSVFMAHYDVVPVNEAMWTKPPFDAETDEAGVIWARGTLDTKGTLVGVMEAAEALLAKGFVPKNDIYLSFSGEEEIAGPTATDIADHLAAKGVTPQLVIDEGGAVVDGIFPGVSEPCALVGIAEKGIMDLRFDTKSAGGHASTPPPHGPVGVLAKAVVDIENHPFKFTVPPAVAEMFDTLGRRSTFVYRMIFSNLWCFGGLLNVICKKKGGELNALVRTTCAFTQMQGSSASNVLPPEASMVANLRLITGQSSQSAVDYLKKTINNPDVELTVIHASEASISSVTESSAWERVKSSIEMTWPDAIVSPYLMIAASDSRHFCKISDKVMRFSAMQLTKEERGLIHGNNERIPTEKFLTAVEFFTRLMEQC